ncbi:MAG: DsrE family protein [Rhodospirillales bacterium]|nr:DsrE family protein [Rhodospirillales bacterium]
MLKRITLSLAALFAVLVIAGWSAQTYAAEKSHRIVFHLDDSDSKRMNLVLNNAANVDKYYKAKGEEVTIEIVAYGPGLTMLVAGKSPVEKRVKGFAQNYDNISFRACGNTHKKMIEKAGKDVPLIPNAKMVTSGVVHLVQRQEEGWSYVRP